MNEMNSDGHSRDQANLPAWDSVATFWDETLGDGNDMYKECLLPTVLELAAVQPDQHVLDLGTGSAVVACALADAGGRVTATDGSLRMLDTAEARIARSGRSVKLEVVDLMDKKSLADLAARTPNKFDVICLSMVLKELPDLEVLANALPQLLSPSGCIIIITLHPVFSKPAGHRAMEVVENSQTGKQEVHRYIKVQRYLNIETVKSEALHGQPHPLDLYHRPFWSLLDPFFRNRLVLDAMREPAFSGLPDLAQIQSYHNFQQFPMLLAVRLRLGHGALHALS